jgi:hypothetical protein
MSREVRAPTGTTLDSGVRETTGPVPPPEDWHAASPARISDPRKIRILKTDRIP